MNQPVYPNRQQRRAVGVPDLASVPPPIAQQADEAIGALRENWAAAKRIQQAKFDLFATLEPEDNAGWALVVNDQDVTVKVMALQGNPPAWAKAIIERQLAPLLGGQPPPWPVTATATPAS